VKRIAVKPGAALSLQMHDHRAEQWIVVKGTAKVTRGDETFLASENESTFIPLGTQYRLENPGKVTLEMFEVQPGSYLGEDDMVRFEDVYGPYGVSLGVGYRPASADFPKGNHPALPVLACVY